MKKLFTLLLAVVASVGTMFADYSQVKIGDLYYNLKSKDMTAEVTYKSYGLDNSGMYKRYNVGWNITTADIPTSVTYNDATYSVTSIGTRAFQDCEKLESVIIPESITRISDHAFAYCSKLTTVVWNAINCGGFSSDNSPFKYAVGAAYYNSHYDIRSQITSFTFGDKVKSVPSCLCESMKSLTSIVLPDSVKYIGGSAFKGCTGLTSPVYNSRIFAYMPSTYQGAYTIPDGIEQIATGAFYECSGLTGISFPSSVTSIGGEAFSYCAGLNSVTIPDNVTLIGYYAFSDCSSLTDISLPGGIQMINDGTFTNCSSLTSISIPESVKFIGYDAFSNCSSLNAVTIPDSVMTIRNYAFAKCTSLNAINIPECLSELGDCAFRGCSELKEIAWNAKSCRDFSEKNTPFYFWSTSYYSDNFDLRSQITSFTLGEKVDTVPAYLCSGMKNLTSMKLPENVKSVGDFAFKGCESLDSVVYNSHILAYYPANYVYNTNNSSILAGIETIAGGAFYDCYNMYGITIPESVTSIGNSAFAGCRSLYSVFIESSTPASVLDDVFPTRTRIYVPLGSLNTYKATNWNTYNICVFDVGMYVHVPSAPTTSVITFNAYFDYRKRDTCVVAYGVEGGEEFDSNIVELNGLEPQKEYTDYPLYLRTTAGDIQPIKVSFTTSALELTTQLPKPVSSTTAILLAETNMSDAEISCGFEYKRDDAPEAMPGTKVYCPVSNGTMAGRLKNLKDDVYYKYRAFYQSAEGEMYYGDWQYIFTGDVSVEFDPVIYTYEATSVKENEATLKGYAIAGAEDFTEQGFEYWADSRVPQDNNAPARMRAALGEHKTVQATGIKMQVTLTDLDAGTVYKYRTYAKVGDQVCYGTEMTFTTKGVYEEEQGLEQITNDQSPINHKILHNGQIYILRGDKAYTITGQRL